MSQQIPGSARDPVSKSGLECDCSNHRHQPVAYRHTHTGTRGRLHVLYLDCIWRQSLSLVWIQPVSPRDPSVSTSLSTPALGLQFHLQGPGDLDDPSSYKIICCIKFKTPKNKGARTSTEGGQTHYHRVSVSSSLQGSAEKLRLLRAGVTLKGHLTSPCTAPSRHSGAAKNHSGTRAKLHSPSPSKPAGPLHPRQNLL